MTTEFDGYEGEIVAGSFKSPITTKTFDRRRYCLYAAIVKPGGLRWLKCGIDAEGDDITFLADIKQGDVLRYFHKDLRKRCSSQHHFLVLAREVEAIKLLELKSTSSKKAQAVFAAYTGEGYLGSSV